MTPSDIKLIVIGLIIVSLLGTIGGLWARGNTYKSQFETEQSERKRYKNLYDETLTKNTKMSASIEKQNTELKARQDEAIKRDAEIEELQKKAKEQAQPRIEQSKAIRTMKLGDNECENLKKIIDDGIKP